MQAESGPEIKLLAGAISTLQDQVFRVVNNVMKLKNEMQQLKNMRA